MHNVEAVTASQLWERLAGRLLETPTPVQESDRGTTRELLHVSFTLTQPQQRWVSSRRPPINVAFALAEVLWILTGRRDAAFLNAWNSQLAEFVGGEQTHHGAYGYRLRQHLGFDQLERACEALSKNPHTRQIVLQLWDSRIDLPNVDGTPASQDIPCNVVSLPKIRAGRLEWMQVMRSNDLVRGLPYNLAQFTFLQEVMAGWLTVDLGTYNQISDSLHLYERDHAFVQAIQRSNVTHVPLSYALDWAESRRVLIEVMRRVELIAYGASAEETRSMVDGLPMAYGGIVAILGAEAARRRKLFDEALALADLCRDQALKEMWVLWYESRPSTRNREQLGQVSTGHR
jgi:thymidylate synthase